MLVYKQGVTSVGTAQNANLLPSERRGMKFLIRRYFSGFCTYEINADDEDLAYEKAKNLPIDEAEILSNLEGWEDCDEVESEINA